MIRKWDITNEELSRQCKDEIIARIEEQGDSQFGLIAAQEIIDIVGQHLGPEVYNRAIDDAKKLVEEKLADLDTDLDILKR